VGEIPLLPFRTHREITSEWLAEQQNGAGEQGPLPHQTEFLIRPARVDDDDEIIGLLATIPANRDLTAEQWTEVRFRLREAPGLEVYVAQTRQQPPLIIGCAVLSIVRALTEGRGFMNDMAVLPTYQRKGVGAELLEAILKRAHQLNLVSLMVNTQRGNDQARAFYAASGFAQSHIMLLKMR
jgi:N-acetylglutamate synthase-like GNAT family acetyltransferase